jgi:hypothetical protein
LRVLFQGQGQSRQKLFSAIDAQYALERMGEFDGSCGVAAEAETLR